MPSTSQDHRPDLTLVSDDALSAPARDGRTAVATHDLDWTIFMARAQRGDRDAYRRLLESVTPYLRSIAARSFHSRDDIEDAVQDVLLTIHSIRHTYDPARPFGPWLVAIANRRVVDCLRRHGRTRGRENSLEDEHETFAAPASNLPEGAAEGRLLREAVDALPEGQRNAVRMMKLEGLSLKEASTASGMSVAALKVATHRGMKNLRKLLLSGERKGDA